MGAIEDKYHQEVQKYLDFIKSQSDLFHQKCDQLRIEAEESIRKIDPKDPVLQKKEIDIKVKLKTNLDQMLREYDSSLRGKFINNIEVLEEIYHQKELLRLNALENEMEIIYQQ
jgi:formate dehydrogenase maturation protein FdhE